jgi:hypothetical protein
MICLLLSTMPRRPQTKLIIALGIRRRWIDTFPVRQWAEIAQSIPRLSTGLDGPGVESRWGRHFLRPSIKALGLTHLPAQRVIGLFLRGKAPGAWRSPPTPSSAEVNVSVELYFYVPSGLSRQDIRWSLSFLLCLLGPTSEPPKRDPWVVKRQPNLSPPVQNTQGMLSSVIHTLLRRKAVLTPSTALLTERLCNYRLLVRWDGTENKQRPLQCVRDIAAALCWTR